MNRRQGTYSETDPSPEDGDAVQGTESDVESALDEALEESFPASDPVAISIAQPPCAPT